MRFTLLIEEDLGEGKFVVTNSCRQDVPLGTCFNLLTAERRELANGSFVFKEARPDEDIALTIVAIDFWRRPVDCVPYGHHAGVTLDGRGLAMVAGYLARHPCPWAVSVEAVEWSRIAN